MDMHDVIHDVTGKTPETLSFACGSRGGGGMFFAFDADILFLYLGLFTFFSFSPVVLFLYSEL